MQQVTRETVIDGVVAALNKMEWSPEGYPMAESPLILVLPSSQDRLFMFQTGDPVEILRILNNMSQSILHQQMASQRQIAESNNQHLN